MAQARKIVLAIAAGAVLSGSALAADVTLRGCASAGVEAGCVMLEMGGVVYDITAAKPKPEPGTFGTVTGSTSDKVSMCQQGTILDPAEWAPDPSTACPK